jgi:3-hydroxyacyl-CoA dehydrogenase/enoyl-CoA hydratase/3-hydroxybutyryl-CoA epimerase
MTKGTIEIDRRKDGTGIVRLRFVRPANRFDEVLLEALERAVSALEEEPDLRGVLFLGGTDGVFIDGFDPDWLDGLTDSEAARAFAVRGGALMDRIAAIAAPTAAVIDGPCLGPGLALALACGVRIASDRGGTRLGVPECRLGLVPVFGATQRLPRLVGLSRSLRPIVAGRPLDARAARRIGLVDAVVPRPALEEEAERRLRESPPRRTPRLSDRVVARSAFLRTRVLDRVRREIGRKTGGFYPAPFRALDVIERGLRNGHAEGLDREARAFGDLVIGRASRNLRFLERGREAARASDGPWGGRATPGEIGFAGVIGAGTMGAGIAGLLVDAGVRTRLMDLTTDRLSAALRRIDASRGVKAAGRRERERRMDRVTTTTDMRGFGRADIVIEAVPEEIGLKRDIIARIEEAVPPRCVIATNTSSLPVAELAGAARRPSRLVGLHFFHPVERMPLVEIVAGEKTSATAARAAFRLAKRLGKVPVVVRDGPGFLVNRLLMAGIDEAFHLLEEGVSIEAIDGSMRDFGFRAGPFQIIDRVGFEVAARVAARLAAAFGGRETLSRALLSILDPDRPGGAVRFYDDAGRAVPEIEAEARREGGGPAPWNLPGIRDRMLFAMINEAAACLESRVVACPGDVELAAVFGFGFPPFRGGPLHHADRIGITRVVDALEALRERHGERFRPAGLLRTMAAAADVFFPGV